jgi:hypothetical protein
MSFGLNQSGGDSNYDSLGDGGNEAAGFGGGNGMMVDSSSSDHPINSSSIDPSTPWTAIAEGNLSLLRQSLQQLEYPMYVADEMQGYTLLQAAASYNHMHLLQYVWSELQQCNHPRENDDTASTTATSACPEGGYQNAVDFDGDTALHYAGSVEVMKFLIDTCRIDIHMTNQNQMTALDAKRTEMHEIEQDVDDFDEDDIEYIQLKDMVQYLESITRNPQDIL